MKSILLLSAAVALHAQVLYVAPDGDSLAAARDKARAGSSKRIVVRGGAYFLNEPVVFDARDAGLTVESAPAETPVFYGGRRIMGWRKDSERFWSAEVQADFRMLVVNGRRAQPARMPVTGYLTHETEFKVRWMGTSGGGWQRKPTEAELNTMRYRAGDLGPWLDTASAELTIYHMWDESLVRLRSHNETARTLVFANPAGHPAGAFGVQRYVVWNIREGMTQPGQWYLDRKAKRVFYWPREGEDMTRAEAIAPVVESIVRIEKTTGVTLRGLHFSVTNTPPIAGGFGAGKFDGAVVVDNSDDCRLEDLAVFNTGGQGIKAQNARGLRIQGCEVRDTGACGIIARGESGEIADNHVHHVGAAYPSAIGIYCGGKALNVSHNEVHDTPYTAVNCGGSGHRLESNLIYRAMLELNDGAAFYTIFGKGIVIRGNLVRDIPDTGGYGSSSYYLDELSEDCLVEGNVSVGVTRPSHNHMTKPNTIRNNIFLHDGDMRITCPRSAGLRFEKNVLAAKGKISITTPECIAESSANLFWSGNRVIEGAPPETLLADPRVEVNEGRYTFPPGSAAARLGIAPVDVSAAGRRKR